VLNRRCGPHCPALPCGSGSAAAAHGFTSSSRKWTLNGRSCVASGIQYSTCSSPGSLDVTAAEYSSAHSLCRVALRCFALLCIGTPERLSRGPLLWTTVYCQYSTVLYGAIQCSTVLSTTVCCQYSRRTVELRVVVQQREPTEVALVERERQRPRAALGGVPQQRQVDLRFSQWKQSQQSQQSQALQRRQRSAPTRIAVRVAPMYGIGSSAASACRSTGEQSIAVYC
jgi:hypothetical protein